MIWLCGVCDTDLETRKELRPGLNINIHTRNKLDQNPKLESVILPRKHTRMERYTYMTAFWLPL